VTFLVSENTFKGQGGQVSFIENGTDSRPIFRVHIALGKETVSGLFFGLPRGRRVGWWFRCREITCTQFSSPKGEPRLTLLRTALSSAAVSGLLTRSVQRGERAMGLAESRRGSRSGSSSHRLSEPHLQSSARFGKTLETALIDMSLATGLWKLADRALPRFKA
jgi:hypothetical protein